MLPIVVDCSRESCRYNSCSVCNATYLFIDDDGDCTSYENYRNAPEYRHKFYKSIKPGKNTPMSKKAEYGKQYEINGYIFFTTDNTSFHEAEENAYLTESRTGCSVGQMSYVKEHFEKIRQKIDAYEIDVESLPEITPPQLKDWEEE